MFTTLSVTEAKIASDVMVEKDMQYINHLMESLGLLVELLMVLAMDKSGAIDIANSWSVDGRMHHVYGAIIFFTNSITRGW